MYVGIDVGKDRTFVVAVMDENKVVKSINTFWKEGLLWFLEHNRARIISVNAPLYIHHEQTEAEKQLGLEPPILENKEIVGVPKYSFELFNKLYTLLGYELANEKNIKNTSKKLVARVYTQPFYERMIKKEVLPITTREGIEQRLYKLPKTGIIVDRNILSTDRKMLAREVESIIAAYNSYCIDRGDVEIYGKLGEEQIFSPKYKFVLKSKRFSNERKKENYESKPSKNS